jgi:hypothetical protein
MVSLFSMLIPVVTAFVLWQFFERKTLWWEFLIPFAVSIVLVITAKLLVEDAFVKSEEYWGSFVDRVEYYEEWDEWIDQTCTRECCCDSKGENCSTETYDCSYRRDHPAEWVLINTIGESIQISQIEYERLKHKLGNDKFVDMHRDYYHIDGDMYTSIWDRDSLKATPVTTLHYYDNRIKASDASVFHFDDLDEKDVARYGLKQYPSILDRYKMDAVLGDQSNDAAIANAKLKHLNAELGPRKEICLFILVFKNQPLEAAFKQEAFWKGANMNEFVVCIGINDDREVQWNKVISWTTNERLKMDVTNMVNQQKTLNLCSIVDRMNPMVSEGFSRRDFQEFNYLTVEPPTWAIVLVYTLVLLVNIGLTLWIIGNEHEEGYSGRMRWKY